MPSGYTAAIADGNSFEQFAMGCARAFGACITMRDEPSSTPIPEKFEPSSYHLDQIEKCKARLAEFMAMSPEQCAEAAEQDFLKAEQHLKESIESRKQLKVKYAKVLAQVDQWTPPSNDHAELKRFMREQIEQSIKFDCDTSYFERNVPQRIDPELWRAEQIGTIEERIAYHRKGHAEEVERTNQRNEWIRLLRESLAR